MRDVYKRQGNNLYLILSGNRPADGKITLNVPGCKLQKADIKAIQKGQEMIFTPVSYTHLQNA